MLANWKSVGARVLLVAVVAGISAGITVASAWVSGPSVSGGQNPLRTFSVYLKVPPTGNSTLKEKVFEVPQGQTLVITDVVMHAGNFDTAWSTATQDGCFPQQGCVIADGKALLCTEYPADSTQNLQGPSQLRRSREPHLTTGIAMGSGSKVELGAAASVNFPNVSPKPSCDLTVTATGYLMRN